MAEKHKSKYKAPKDFEKSQKPKPRKDLKDYTVDDKKGGSNPKSTGDKQLNVLRKTDKEMVDTGDMFVKYNAEDRLYKDLEKAEWEPKDAAKKLKKRQDKEERETADVLKDKIENLTREQKERLVREYIRRKITKVLLEAEGDKTKEETPAPEAPTPEETPEAPTGVDAAATETPMPDTTTPPPAAPAPTPETPTDTAAAPTEPGTDIPGAATSAEDQPAESESVNLDSSKFSELGNIKKINKIAKFFNATKDKNVDKQINFYQLLRKYSIKKLAELSGESKSEKSES